MLYRAFGKTGMDVSVIGLGTWNIGNQWGAIDDATAWATIRAAYDHGVNLFDTAEGYGAGKSEEVLGKALKGKRENVYIATKSSGPTYAAAELTTAAGLSLPSPSTMVLTTRAILSVCRRKPIYQSRTLN